MKREIYTVRWDKQALAWDCPQFGFASPQKLPLVRRVAYRLHRRWITVHILCQLRLYGKNGRIQSERTYGRDPKRFKG